jgi:hypothetical protein
MRATWLKCQRRVDAGAQIEPGTAGCGVGRKLLTQLLIQDFDINGFHSRAMLAVGRAIRSLFKKQAIKLVSCFDKK